MAEFIMKQLLAEACKADQVEVASAAVTGDGIIGGVGNPMDPRAQRELAKNGVLFSQHRARLLTREDYDKYDYLIAMDSENFMAMNQICGGDPERKQYKLLQFAGSYADIDDPWYTNDFDLAFQEISRGCRGLLDQL